MLYWVTFIFNPIYISSYEKSFPFCHGSMPHIVIFSPEPGKQQSVAKRTNHSKAFCV